MFSASTDDSAELFGGTAWTPDEEAKVEDDAEFSLEMLETQEDKHLYEICFQVDNRGSYEDAYFLIGGALHDKCGGATDTWHLALWRHWCDGGPFNAEERERLFLVPGPPRPRVSPQSHTSATCKTDWSGFRTTGKKKTFGSVKYHLDTDPNTKHTYLVYKQRRVKEMGENFFWNDLVNVPDVKTRKFNYKKIADIAVAALPLAF